MQGFPVFERRDGVWLRFHAEFHIAVDPTRHFAGGRDLPILMHEVTGVAVTSPQRIAAILIILVDVENHLRGELVKFFFCRKL
jgi:hypothetical protein